MNRKEIAKHIATIIFSSANALPIALPAGVAIGIGGVVLQIIIDSFVKGPDFNKSVEMQFSDAFSLAKKEALKLVTTEQQKTLIHHLNIKNINVKNINNYELLFSKAKIGMYESPSAIEINETMEIFNECFICEILKNDELFKVFTKNEFSSIYTLIEDQQVKQSELKFVIDNLMERVLELESIIEICATHDNRTIDEISYDSSYIFSSSYSDILFDEELFTNKIRLCDIYIEPTFSSYNEKEHFSNFHDLYSKFGSGIGLIVEGEPGAGKSAFVMNLAYQYMEGKFAFNKNIYFIQGKDIKNSNGNPLQDISNVLGVSDSSLLSGAILILDAYDEISYASESRVNNRKYISKLISECENTFLFITSRVNYIDDMQLPKVKLNKLSPSQIRDYINTYNILRVDSERIDNDFIDSLIELKTDDKSDEFGIVSVPLFLYIVLVNKVNIDEIEDIYDLYEKVFYKNNDIGSVLTTRGGHKKDVKSESLDIANNAFKLAQHIAHLMYIQNSLYVREQDIFKKIDQFEIDSQLAEKLKNRFGVEIYLQTNSRRIFTFVHKSIYEYFASKYIYNELSSVISNYLIEAFDIETTMSSICIIFTPRQIEYNVIKFFMFAVERQGYGDVLELAPNSDVKIESLVNELLSKRQFNLRSDSDVPFWEQQWIMMNWIYSCLGQIVKYKDKTHSELRIDPYCVKYLLTTHNLIVMSRDASYSSFDNDYFMINRMDMSNVDFEYLHFSFMLICNTNFENCKIASCGFFNVHFAYQTFYKVFFCKSLFKFCDFMDVTFFECDLRNVNFNEQDLRGVRFIKCDLRDASFFGSILDDVVFDKCHIYSEDFNDVECIKACFDSVIVHNYTSEDAEMDVFNYWE